MIIYLFSSTYYSPLLFLLPSQNPLETPAPEHDITTSTDIKQSQPETPNQSRYNQILST